MNVDGYEIDVCRWMRCFVLKLTFVLVQLLYAKCRCHKLVPHPCQYKDLASL